MMSVKAYQVIMVIVCLYYLYGIIKKYRKVKVNLIETILGLGFWFFLLSISIFPDYIGSRMGRLLGFESNTNAVIFILLGLSLFILYRLYQHIRMLRQNITALTRRLALLEHEIEQNEDSLRS